MDSLDACLSGYEELIKALIRNAAEERNHPRQEVNREARKFLESDDLEIWVKILSFIKGVNLKPDVVRWTAYRYQAKKNNPVRHTERKSKKSRKISVDNTLDHDINETEIAILK